MTRILGIGLLAFLLYFLEKRIYERHWSRGLKVNIGFSQQGIFEGEEGELFEVIENRKRLPLSMLKVKFQTSRNLKFKDAEGSRFTDRFYRNDVFQIGGGEKITRTLSFIGGKRGYYRIEGIDLVGADLFLTQEYTLSLTNRYYFYVYPKPFDSRRFRLSLQQLNGEILTKRHLLEDPFEYRGIREYQPYDDLRSVNWKATARTGELKVNQKNYTALQTIRIFFNIEDTGILKREEAVEASLQIAAGLARFFLSQGIRIALYGNGKDMVGRKTVDIDPGAGEGQLQQVYKALARVDTADTENFRACLSEKLLTADSHLMTIFIAPNGYEDFLLLLQECRQKKMDFVWFYPTVEKERPKLPDWCRPYVRVIDIRS